jgi:hypothetical protein
MTPSTRFGYIGRSSDRITLITRRHAVVPIPQAGPRVGRSTLPRDEARRRYVAIGELVALEQIKTDSEALDSEALDSEALDSGSVAIGPFARLDANTVAARDGKTRGVITNLFGSQAAFQAETMALALSATDLIEQIDYPRPADYPSADEWVDALFDGEAARGPSHGAEPVLDYAALWALWLSAVPYGIWSEAIAGPSVDENRAWLARLEVTFRGAIDHFDMILRDGTTVGDLACAVAGMVEGLWLNQCLTTRHPTDPLEPIATAMRRSGRLLWYGATLPRS